MKVLTMFLFMFYVQRPTKLHIYLEQLDFVAIEASDREK